MTLFNFDKTLKKKATPKEEKVLTNLGFEHPFPSQGFV
jgi:hypothetical protein